MKFRLAVILPMWLLTSIFCYYAAFLLRFEFDLTPDIVALFQLSLPPILAIKLALFLTTGEWRRSFRYGTLADVQSIVLGTTAATSLIFLASHLRILGPIPRSVILIDWALAVPMASFLRIGGRLYTESIRTWFVKQEKLRSLVYGTNREGIEILRSLRTGESEYHVVGLIDDRPENHLSLIAGVPVYSMTHGLKKLSSKSRATQLLIPGSVPGRHIRRIVAECAEAGLKAHVIPGLHELVNGRYKVTIRDITISDLLRREPAQLDVDGIRKFVENQRVLVTGAAGSIGSELCRHLLRFNPEELVLLDQSELGMFTIEQEFTSAESSDSRLEFLMADVLDQTEMYRIISKHRPQLVFHTAAYKHVPLMEKNPQQAIRNNVFGTKSVVDAAERSGVERFVLISTDKAVHPNSVMGATKLVAEKYVQAASVRAKMQCVAVRFGNVLNSAGSVVPTFRKQIEAGGPVTVTHPEMERFFMTIPEAVQLVIQAGAIGSSGDVLILDMGEPARIVDLAKDMIALSGFKYPDDIDIVFTGLRPGEKLREELFYNSEDCTDKVHDKIFCARREMPDPAQIDRDVARLQVAVRGTEQDAIGALQEVVARYVAVDEVPAAPLKSAA